MIKDYIDTECVINLNYYDSIKEIIVCNICTGILINARECSSCQNSFCKNCLDEWICFNESCPYKCKKTEFRESSRTLKNLLEKLHLKCLFCPNSEICYTYLNYINHIKNCENIKMSCPTCSANVFKKDLNLNKIYEKIKTNYNDLSEKYSLLKEENKKLREELDKIKESQNESCLKIIGNNNNNLNNHVNSKMNINNQTHLFASNLHARRNSCLINNNINSLINNNVNNDISETGIIDKCEHFKGNYMPIFSCCEKSFPCYICHDKFTDHEYKISNKVVCLICKNIYSGPKCNVCNTHQIYRKK